MRAIHHLSEFGNYVRQNAENNTDEHLALLREFNDFMGKMDWKDRSHKLGRSFPNLNRNLRHGEVAGMFPKAAKRLKQQKDNRFPSLAEELFEKSMNSHVGSDCWAHVLGCLLYTSPSPRD